MDTDLDGPFGQLFGDSGSLFCAPKSPSSQQGYLSLSLSVVRLSERVGRLVGWSYISSLRPLTLLLALLLARTDGEEWTKVDAASVGECGVHMKEYQKQRLLKQQH